MFGQFKATCLACSLMVATGCGPQVGTVSGRVSYEGEPIPVGNVTFYGEQNQVVFAQLTETGTYSIDRVPVGKVLVTVETPNVKPFVLEPGQPPPPPGMLSPAYRLPNIPIPVRYRDRRSSGLETTVQTGEQTYDITLVAEPE